MAIRTEIISIAMPQPAEAKFPGIYSIPDPREFLQLGMGWGAGLGSLLQMDTQTVEWTLSIRDVEAFCWEQNNARSNLGPFFRGSQRWNSSIKENVNSTVHKSRSPSWRPRGARESRIGLRKLEGRVDSPCRAGMAFHTDTGPWLANWPSDTSRKKMGNPARASIIR